MAEETQYDVFLSHNSADKPAVEYLARQLVKAGVQPWLDKWNLIPGEPWQEAVEEALARCATCAVFVGPSGTGPWQNEEMRAAVDRRVSESGGRFRVIPVLLPGAERGERSRLPTFLTATTWVEFHRSLDDQEAFYRLVCGIRGIEPGPTPGEAVYEGACPYQGLRFFDVQHAPFFFGREALTEWLLNELCGDNRFLAIIGPSGSGKSSLARAGLLAALKKGQIEGSADWSFVISRPAANPLESLATSLSGVTGTGQDPAAVISLIRSMRENENALHVTTSLALRSAPPARRLVILEDQFEELFTLCHDDGVRQAFIDNLLYAANVAQGQTIVLLTLRADFYGKCATYRRLADALSDRSELIGPMTTEELRLSIERPAQLVGMEFEPGLVETLLRDVQDQPGSLPLLQHTLLELWEKRAGRRLTHAAYRDIGGVAGALERRADEVYASFTAPEQEICRRIFLRLTRPGEGTEDTKRRAMLQELLPAEGEREMVEEVVRTLAGEDVRLVTTEGGDTSEGERFIEVAHEALIRGWPRLREWIEQDRAVLRIHRRLTEAANGWAQYNRDESYLYRGARLAEVEKIARIGDLSALEREFIQASKRARHRRLALRVATVSLALLFLIAGGFVIRLVQSLRSPWQPVAGFPSDPVLALAVTNESFPTCYAGTGDIGVGRSKDGVTWTLHRQGLPTAEVPAGGVAGKDVRDVGQLAIDVLNSQRVFAFVAESGIHRSEDGGETWQAANAGLPDEYITALVARGDLVLAVFDTIAGGSLYASLNSGASWELVGGQGEAPLDKVYAAYIAPGGDQVYVGAEGGLYSSSIGPPWSWEQITTLPPVNIIAPEAGDGSGFYLAAYSTSLDQGDIYHWLPGEKVHWLATVDGLPIRLAPHPDSTTSVATYVLLFNGQVLAVTDEGQIQSLDQRPGVAFDLLAASHPTDEGVWLLLGHEDGLLEYRGTLDTTQR